jgi:predicted house-cleaning noncanonical NTP pyrophosphatase (MazG superfamily)
MDDKTLAIAAEVQTDDVIEKLAALVRQIAEAHGGSREDDMMQVNRRNQHAGICAVQRLSFSLP